MTDAVKETKAQRVERLKREKNPWEGLEEIRNFARQGFLRSPKNGLAPTSVGGAFTRRATAAVLWVVKTAKARHCPISWFESASPTEFSPHANFAP